jgi:predicted dehydrogenase
LRHLKVINSLNIETIAVPARKEKVKELSKKGYKTATDMKEAKRMGAVGVIVCTNTSRHITDCEEALDLDYCVLCEKPLASSAAEAIKLKNKIRGNLFIGYNLRFDDGFKRLFKTAEELGEINFINCECRSYLPDWRKGRNYLEGYAAKPKEGGVLLDLSHEIDYLNYFYEKPKAIIGTTKNWGILKIAEEEFASAILEYSQSVANVTLDYISKNSFRKCSIGCEKGEIYYDFIMKKIQITKEGKNQVLKVKRETDDLYKKEIGEFIGIILNKKKIFLCEYEEAYNVLITIQAWKRSSLTGNKQNLNYFEKNGG